MLEDNNKDKVIAIISYCNTDRKLDILINNIVKIRNNYPDIKIALHANYPLSESVQKMVDYYFYSDLNVYYDKYCNVWRILPYFNKKFIYHFYTDFSYSVFQQIKYIINRLIDYKRILLMNYDTVLEKEHVEQMNSNIDLILYSWTKGGDDASLLIINFNPKEFSKISNTFSFEKHIELKHLTAEQTLYWYIKNSNINYIKFDESVSDTISNMPYYAFKNDYFNENLLSFNNNKLEIYLWHLLKTIDNITIKIDENIFTLINQNKKGAFEYILDYDKEISDIKIISINNTEVIIPLSIVKNTDVITL